MAFAVVHCFREVREAPSGFRAQPAEFSPERNVLLAHSTPFLSGEQRFSARPKQGVLRGKWKECPLVREKGKGAGRCAFRAGHGGFGDLVRSPARSDIEH
ncbi:hypothetical protein JCM3263A_11860 [Thermobifida fusca]